MLRPARGTRAHGSALPCCAPPITRDANKANTKYDTEEDIGREIDARPPSCGIVQPLVDAALAHGDTRRAQQLLEHFIDRLGEEEFSTRATLKLFDVYDQTQQSDMRLVTLYKLIVNGRPQNDDQLRSWLRKLRIRGSMS